jgi:hypothetical protein
MTEPEITFGSDSECVLWDENEFLVSMDYDCHTEKQYS